MRTDVTSSTFAYPGSVKRPHDDIDRSEVDVVRHTSSIVDVARKEVQHAIRNLQQHSVVADMTKATDVTTIYLLFQQRKKPEKLKKNNVVHRENIDLHAKHCNIYHGWCGICWSCSVTSAQSKRR